MNIRFSFDQRFESQFNRIKEKHGEDILRFAGVHPEQLDLAKFTRDFLFTNHEEGTSVADMSVDSNANSDDNSVVAYDHESAKAFSKLNAVNIIWEYIIKTQEMLGASREKSTRLANSAIEDIITCGVYLNDSHFIHKAYCYAFDLTNLVNEGMPFVKKIGIEPPKHMSSFIDLIVQSVAFISNQIAGAASLPNLLVYMDYFARKDHGDSYWEKEDSKKLVAQAFQTLVYSLNFSFRGSQCVDEYTEILTPNGFKKYTEITVGDPTYVWNNGNLDIEPMKAINVYDFDGNMHKYIGRDYIQQVTPDHRVLRKKFNSKEFELVQSKNLIDFKTPITMPVATLTDTRPDFDITDEEIELAVFILTDGNIDNQENKSSRIKWFKLEKRWGSERFEELMDHFGYTYNKSSKDGWEERDKEKYPESYPVNTYSIPAEFSEKILTLIDGIKSKIPRWALQLSRRQAQLFIETWASLDGNIDENAYDRMKLQCDNMEIADDIQHICFLSGKGSTISSRLIGTNKTETIYVRPYNRTCKDVKIKQEVYYKGKVWCPTTDAGIVVFRKEGKVFISGNSAFTNMSIYDREFMKALFGHTIYPDESKPDFESIYKLQEMFIVWFNNESQKQSFTFPVLNANMAIDESQKIRKPNDMEFVDFIAEQDLPYGALNFYAGETTSLSMCCRLRSKLNKKKEHTSSLGTGSVSTGSHRVCNIPLARIAIESDGDKEEFFKILKHRLSEVHAILNAHREILKDMIKIKGKLPLYEYGWMHLSKQYSTVGIMGPYEACMFMGMDIETDEGTNFIVEVMQYINTENEKEEKRWDDGREFNIELIPGEQANIKVCEADKMLFPSFFKSTKYKHIDIYANQYIPLPKKVPVWKRMELQGKFDSLSQGGGIMHLNVDHRLRNKEQARALILAAIRSGVISFAINYNIARCTNEHISVGKYDKCPVCSAKIVSNRTRVVGFNTEVSDWHKVRRREYKQRHFYNFDNYEEPDENFPEELFMNEPTKEVACVS